MWRERGHRRSNEVLDMWMTSPWTFQPNSPETTPWVIQSASCGTEGQPNQTSFKGLTYKPMSSNNVVLRGGVWGWFVTQQQIPDTVVEWRKRWTGIWHEEIWVLFPVLPLTSHVTLSSPPPSLGLTSACSGEGVSQTLCSQGAYKLVVGIGGLYHWLEFEAEDMKVL